MALTSPNIRCQLNEWGLPPLIVAWYKKQGIASLFEWQAECLCKRDVLFGGNLVYSAPTSAGKTLVADFLLLKRVLEYGRKALVIEPFVALTREKAATLKSMLYTTKARVGAFGGNYYTPGGLTAVSVAVCTIEKANNFINKLVGENKLSELGIIVVDEIHYVGDERRGHQLELLLTKVLYYNCQQEQSKKIQIVGLSATIPNLRSIASWLNATLYVTTYRPVPLDEMIKISNKIYNVKDYIKNPSCEPLEVINSKNIPIKKDQDDIGFLCLDSIVRGFSTLVFCESKRECETMALFLSEQISYAGNMLTSENPDFVETAQKLRQNLSVAKILDLIDKLKKCPVGCDRELKQAIKLGVAFHHAGLTSEEREIIEDGFKGGAIKILMATSTLSSGVNLPARRVIIRSPTAFYGGGSNYLRDMLNPITYRQMIGRAGRKNIDSSGESILICKQENQDIAIKLIKASLGDINSSLGHRMIASEGEPSGLKKAILEVIANNTAKTRVHLNQYLTSTFWRSCPSDEEDKAVTEAITKTLRYLVKNKFIEELKPGVYRSTRLGNAVLAAGLHPDESLELLQDLIQARKGFCLNNDLHIIYQVTPADIARSTDIKDWKHYSDVWNQLDETSQFVGSLVGVDEITVARRCQGFMGNLDEEKERIYRRFWIALIINDLINEMPLMKICTKYRVSKSVVQQAQRAVAQFAGVMSIFCQELGYDNIAALVHPLESRINFSCQRDLLELIKLNISRPVARSLFNSGYKNIITLAKGDKLDVDFAIRQNKPFRKDLSFSSVNDQAPSMWVPELAKTLSTLDYACHIVETARHYVEIEYEIELPSQNSKRKQDLPLTPGTSVDSSSFADSEAGDTIEQGAPKRGRLENGTSLSEDEADQRQNEQAMVKVKKDVPNFVVEYVGREERDVYKFMDKWVLHSKISLNFKLEKFVNKPIGGNIKQLTSRRKRRNSASSSHTIESEDSDDEDSCEYDELRDGLALPLDIDHKQHVLSRLYACFDDDPTVYIINTHEAFNIMKSNLGQFLYNSYSSATAQTATQRMRDFVPIKLFTQNIVLTYKVLHAAFGIDPVTLNHHFEWHAFDVAWWMVNNCPNRGINNRNSSLSLVARTKWVPKYRHFLYPEAKRSTVARAVAAAIPGTSTEILTEQEEHMRLKDVVKAGKTAILQPLVGEILVELSQRGQLRAYNEAEIPSRLTIAQMMIHGIGLNMNSMRSEMSLYENLSEQLSEIAQRYYAKSSISLTSIKDVARVLYKDLDLKKHLLEHATNVNISKDPTNAEVLKILAEHHPFPRLVQDFRRIGKALEALQSVGTYVRFDQKLDMRRVFGQCDFWQLTGRVSMVDPDLFLINRNFTVIIPEHADREQETIECAPRKCFVPYKGWLYVAADYSQLELRLLAHFSGDENLLEILNRSQDVDETYDVFRTVAARVYKIPPEEVTSENRQHAKQICYGIIYGMGNKSLSIQLGVDVDKAEEFRQDFFNAFPRILTYTEDLLKDCEQTGYVESLLGRRRPVEGIRSEHSSIRSKAKRVIINTRIQSSASDIIKLAMASVNKKILDNFENSARLVLEMHDELIYEVSPGKLDTFAKTLKYTMESISESEKLEVNLLVNLKRGANWSLIEKFQPKETAPTN